MNIANLFKRKMNDDSAPQPVTPNASNDNSTTMQVNDPVLETTVAANWISISDDGEFICSECGNKSAPETNTENGTVTADLSKVKADLEQYPTKVIYGICPVCGMEFTFKHADGKLLLEPSEMMK